MFYNMGTRVKNFPLSSQQTGALEDDIIYVPNSKEIHVTSMRPAFVKKLAKSADLIKFDNPTFKISYYVRMPSQVGPPCSSNFAQSPNQ